MQVKLEILIDVAFRLTLAGAGCPGRSGASGLTPPGWRRERGVMRFLSFLPAAALLLAGCATVSPQPKVQVTAVSPAALSKARTYAWVPDRSGMAANPLNNADVWRGAIRASVDRELAARGYTQAPIKSGGYVMAFHVVRRDKGVYSVVDNYYGYEAPGVRTHLDAFLKEHSPTQDGEATLVIDAVDPQAKKLLWRGWETSRVINPGLPPEARLKAIDGLVGAVLKDFPAR